MQSVEKVASMKDFGEFCYLDVEKTGSEFVSNLLVECSNKEIILREKHATIRKQPKVKFWLRNRPGTFNPETFYFNSVRRPENYYPSLYNYGVDKRGGVYFSLRDGGYGHLYDGTKEKFIEWLDVLFSREKVECLFPDYHHADKSGMGLLSYRILRLSILSPETKLNKIRTISDLSSFYEEKSIAKYTIRNESMKQDLIKLTTEIIPHNFEPGKIESALDQKKRINRSVSYAVSADDFKSHPRYSEYVQADRFVLNTFYLEY